MSNNALWWWWRPLAPPTPETGVTTPFTSQSEAAAEGRTHNTFVWVKQIAYHPRFAAEVVDGEERVDAWDATKMKANHKVPEVLTGDHAVGMLPNQDEVWLERPATRCTCK